jgi:hypothetical protein
MPTLPISTGTTRDMPVLPDGRVRYQPQPPHGAPHTTYRVPATKPVARDGKK